MQINIPDQDVKLHTRILQRLQLLLIVALGLTIATLYNAGAFSKKTVADAKPVAAGSESLASNPSASDELTAAPVEPEGNAVEESKAEVANHHGDTKAREPIDSSIGHASDMPELADPAQTVPVAQLPGPKHEGFDSEASLSISNSKIVDGPSGQAQFEAMVFATDILTGRARTILGDYVRLRKRFQFNGYQIAMIAKRLAASHTSDGPSDANVSTDAVTLETAKSNAVGSDPIEYSADSIVIRNAKVNRGTVAFLIGREVKQLEPGASLQLPAVQTTVVVRFHRGGDFGNATLTLLPGVYEFEATARGWYLETAKE